MVSHHDHHRHSAYLLSHADAAGFSQTEQRRLAAFVLGQRGGLRKVDALLVEAPSAWQLLCLRLAVLLCHARTGVPSKAVALSVDGTTLGLGVDTAWAERHPRTMHLLNEESIDVAAQHAVSVGDRGAVGAVAFQDSPRISFSPY